MNPFPKRIINLNLIDIYDSLLEAYGEQGWWPIRSRKNSIYFNNGGYHPGERICLSLADKFEISVGAILTQNTNWKNASAALDSLINNDMLSYNKILQTPIETVGNLIKKSGYYNQKARKLKELSLFFEKNENNVPSKLDLLSIWGVGNETADSILLYAFNQPFFVIDLYTRRIFSRVSGDETILKMDYEALSCLIQKTSFSLEQMQEYHALLVYHAKEHCNTRPQCNNCPLIEFCKKGY